MHWHIGPIGVSRQSASGAQSTFEHMSAENLILFIIIIFFIFPDS